MTLAVEHDDDAEQRQPATPSSAPTTKFAGDATLINYGNISGAGSIGDAGLTLDNHGDIAATASLTNELILDTGTGASNAITNEAGATLEAQTGATLEIRSDVNNVNATSSVIRANNGGNVELVGITATTITGGTINLDGSTAARATLQIEGTVTLALGTTVTLSNDYSGNAIVSTHDEVPGEATLINYGNISGAGSIGDAGLTLDNHGDIAATASLTNELILDTGTGAGNAITNEERRHARGARAAPRWRSTATSPTSTPPAASFARITAATSSWSASPPPPLPAARSISTARPRRPSCRSKAPSRSPSARR